MQLRTSPRSFHRCAPPFGSVFSTPPSGLARVRLRRIGTIHPFWSLLGCCTLRWRRTSSDIQRGSLHLGLGPGRTDGASDERWRRVPHVYRSNSVRRGIRSATQRRRRPSGNSAINPSASLPVTYDDRGSRWHRRDQPAFPRSAQVSVLYPPLDARGSGCRVET